MQDDVQPALQPHVGVREVAIDVLHHDQRAVGDFPDRDGQPAERHEIGREAQPLHDDEGDERRDEQGDRHYEGAAHVAEKEEKDQHDEDHAFDQRVPNRVDRPRDQLDAVVEGREACAGRQGPVAMERCDLLLHGPHHFAGVAAAEHQDRAGDHFPFAVQHRRPVTHGMADAHLGHIAHEDRRARGLFHDDALDVRQALDEPDPPHDRPLGMPFQHIAAGVGVVVRHRLVDFVERQVVLAELRGVHQDLILLDEPA